MKLSSTTSVLLFSALIMMLILGTLGCSPNAAEMVLSPDLGSQLLTAEAEDVVITLPTPAPPKFTDFTAEEATAGLPDDFADALATADPANGETVAQSVGCFGCHSLDPDQEMIGPTWHNVADTAVSRVADESPALYLYHSIIDPNAYVVQGYPSNIMPQNYQDIMSQEEIADVVSFLMDQYETTE